MSCNKPAPEQGANPGWAENGMGTPQIKASTILGRQGAKDAPSLVRYKLAATI
jgi:hypothetical protein